jgi:hypothetical protein
MIRLILALAVSLVLTGAEAGTRIKDIAGVQGVVLPHEGMLPS